MKKTDVILKVNWPSKKYLRKLPDDLESLCKMLVRGTCKQIALAAWKNPSVNTHLRELMVKEISKEAAHLCSSKDPSCFRKTNKDNMLQLSMESVSSELKDRAPMLHSVLSAVAINHHSRAAEEKQHFGPIAMAAVVLLKNRSRYMTAVQLLVTIFLYHSNWMNTLARLCPLQITCSHTFLYKKLDLFGEDHNKDILNSFEQQGQFMQVQAERERGGEEIIPDKNDKCIVQDGGRKLVFDNIHYRQEVHYMTEEHQNIDAHCVTYMSVENRVSGNHLSSKSVGSVLNLENGKCLPSVRDNTRQHANYVALVGRIIS